MGIVDGHVYEALVSTYGENQTPHLYPVGVIFSPKKTGDFIVRPPQKSHTYANLNSGRCGVLNVTFDAEVLFRAAFEEARPNWEYPHNWFDKAAMVDAPRLRHSEAHIEFSVIQIENDGSERAIAVCRSRNITYHDSFPKPYSRANFAAFEAVLQGLLVRELYSRSELSEAEEAAARLRYYSSLISKTAPDSVQVRIVEDLLSFVDAWRKKGVSEGREEIQEQMPRIA